MSGSSRCTTPSSVVCALVQHTRVTNPALRACGVCVTRATRDAARVCACRCAIARKVDQPLVSPAYCVSACGRSIFLCTHGAGIGLGIISSVSGPEGQGRTVQTAGQRQRPRWWGIVYLQRVGGHVHVCSLAMKKARGVTAQRSLEVPAAASTSLSCGLLLHGSDNAFLSVKRAFTSRPCRCHVSRACVSSLKRSRSPIAAAAVRTCCCCGSHHETIRSREPLSRST